ncbi:MAG: hypothetical protein IPM51_00465 [Sphingobacteriaceae bacterium]|nr:hypothetical protein [Sphingobacteriaceae bacterium]
MRNKIIIIVLISAFKINAQVNLVMNPSFEDPTTCSPQMSTCPLYILPNWGCNLNTPDCYNICVTNTVFGIPSNLLGYQQPFSGFGYVGLHTYGTFGPNVREIIQGTLLQPLVIGQKYFFSFRVSRGDSGVSFFHDKIGLRLSTSPQNSVSINNWAHISTSQLISDK